MDMTAAAIALGILAGVAILIIIPILAILYYLKRRETTRLEEELASQQSLNPQSKKVSHSQINSLPCRLKKKTSSAAASRSAAGESGVYDMAEISPQLSEISNSTKMPVTASFTSMDGETQRLFLYGELSTDDSLAVKEVVSRYLDSKHSSSHQSSAQHLANGSISEDSIADINYGSRCSLSLDDIIISGLDPSASLSFENEGFRKDEYEHHSMNGTSRRRQQVKKTLSALSNKMRMNMRREEKPISKLSDIGSMISCSSVTTYKSAVIGQSGGEIILGGGVKLSVPPNALSERVEIALGVSFDPKHLPQLGEEEGLLTPVVFCQPNGLEFKQPATLHMPHCATQVQESWRINIMSSQSDVEASEMEWRSMQIGEYESRAFCAVASKMELHKHEVQLCVNHFTMYCVTGTAKDKRTACKRKKTIALTSEQDLSTFSAYCVNSYHSKPPHHQTNDALPPAISVESSGQAVKVVIEGLSDEWTQCTDSEPLQFSYSDLWHDNHQPLTLALQSSKQLAEPAAFDLSAWQIGNTSQKYKISIGSSSSKSQNGSGVRNGGRKRNVFSETLRWDIMLLLDPIHAEGNDWRKLAEELNLSAESIKAMEESPSPTKELLRTWEEHSHGCIRSFVAMAVKVHRLDVAEKIEDHVGKLYLETLPNHRCDDHC